MSICIQLGEPKLLALGSRRGDSKEEVATTWFLARFADRVLPHSLICLGRFLEVFSVDFTAVVTAFATAWFRRATRGSIAERQHSSAQGTVPSVMDRVGFGLGAFG